MARSIPRTESYIAFIDSLEYRPILLRWGGGGGGEGGEGGGWGRRGARALSSRSYSHRAYVGTIA